MASVNIPASRYSWGGLDASVFPVGFNAEAAQRAAACPAYTGDRRMVERRIKRCVDVTLTLLLAMGAVPLIGLFALLIRATSPGPAFYAQLRIGQGGQRFWAWKLRTMVAGADQVLEAYLRHHPRERAEWAANHKLKIDPRVTWIGAVLRTTSLDELPQLWNVLRGEMSLVGPRPIVDAEVAKYGDTYRQYRQVPPGITGLWQVSGRNNTTYEERIALDRRYVDNWSLVLDLSILIRTVRVVFLREGAF